MANPWQAEVDVDARLAARLIERQFPDLPGEAVAPLGVGWDNSVFAVGQDWVFRFPRRQLAVGLLESELRCLPAAALELTLAVPVPVHAGVPDEDYPWPFAGYRMLAGATACRAALSNAERRATAAPLARFLAQLHAIPAERVRAWGAAPDTFRRLDVAHRAGQASERLAQVLAAGLIDDGTASTLGSVIADAPLDWEPRARSLCHGDLYARHVLIGADRGPCGVIDWGDLHFGDGTVDLALAHGFLPPEAHATFRQTYGTIDESAWRVARLRALVTNLAVLQYAVDVGDHPLETEGRWALANLAAGFNAQ